MKSTPQLKSQENQWLAGTYEVTVKILVPHVSKGTNPWMRASGTTMTEYSQNITFIVE